MQPNLLNDKLQGQLTDLFETELINPVELLFFSREIDCEMCGETGQLLNEVVNLNDRLSLACIDIDKKPDTAEQYQIERTPGIVIAGKDDDKIIDYGIRFSGIPSGYEFSSLIHAIGIVSRRDSGLLPEIRNELKSISSPTNLKIFVTPT